MSSIALALAAPTAHAAQWHANQDGRYALVVNGQSLVVSCDRVSDDPAPAYRLRLSYIPSCPGFCYFGDDRRLANVFIDKENFPSQLWGGATDEFIVTPQTETPRLINNLVDAKRVAIYSTQVTPQLVEFGPIENPEKLRAFYAQCLSGK